EDVIRDFHVTGVQTYALPISDFVKGVGSLDLSQLLTGEDDTASSLSQYLTFSFSTDTTITVDSNGAAGGGAGQSIVLQGINLQEIGRASCREREDNSVDTGRV